MMGGRGKPRKLWDENKMTQAIAAVRTKEMGFLKAARTFEMPRTTLFRLVNARDLSPTTVAKTKLGRKTVLPAEIEELLVRYCLEMDCRYFGLTR